MAISSIILIVLYVPLFFMKNFYGFCALRFFLGAVNIAITTARTALVRKLADPKLAEKFILY